MSDIVHKICSAASCERSAHYTAGGRGGLCCTHYKRKLLHGDPETVGRRSSPAIDWIIEHARYTADDCLRWPFHVAKDGYGRVHEKGSNKLLTASRAMCVEAHGEPPAPDFEAAHSCGNGNQACTNPRHLYWASRSANECDKVDHGTSNRGERQGQSKLTEADVRYIRSVAGKVPQAVSAKEFGVDQSTISDIVRRKRWAWLD